MFDEKYMKSHDKKIETVEDAVLILSTSVLCGDASCSRCAVRMYCDDNCGDVGEEALRFLIGAKGELFGEDGMQTVYEALFEKGILKKPEEHEQTCKGTCAECYFSKMHTSGIRWCDKFCNFVHEDGYCYQFSPSDNMEAGR